MHPSAWNGCSTNFALTESSAVQPFAAHFGPFFTGTVAGFLGLLIRLPACYACSSPSPP
jgi:hypothetical protein